MSSVSAVDTKSFDEVVLKSDKPILVDFWAEWCGPCKQLTPIVDELANDMAGKVKVVKINIEDAPEAPTKYGVRGVPTLMIFKGGELVDTKVGGMPKSQLAQWVEGNV